MLDTEFTRDFYRLVKFESNRSLANSEKYDHCPASTDDIMPPDRQVCKAILLYSYGRYNNGFFFLNIFIGKSSRWRCRLFWTSSPSNSVTALNANQMMVNGGQGVLHRNFLIRIFFTSLLRNAVPPCSSCGIYTRVPVMMATWIATLILSMKIRTRRNSSMSVLQTGGGSVRGPIAVPCCNLLLRTVLLAADHAALHRLMTSFYHRLHSVLKMSPKVNSTASLMFNLLGHYINVKVSSLQI